MKGKRRVGQQCRDAQDFELKFRGEVRSDVQTHRTFIQRSGDS